MVLTTLLCQARRQIACEGGVPWGDDTSSMRANPVAVLQMVNATAPAYMLSGHPKHRLQAVSHLLYNVVDHQLAQS
eukprot:14762370-Heterocapsa_arctica.AAC.1